MSNNNPQENEFLVISECNGLSIGLNYKGGVIAGFYNDNNDKYCGRCLIVLSNDLDHKLKWSDANCQCASLEMDGYNDWRLPRISELKQIYKNRGAIPGFCEEGYWSSTLSGSGTEAYVQVFNKAQHYNYDTFDVEHKVRPVRDDLIVTEYHFHLPCEEN